MTAFNKKATPLTKKLAKKERGLIAVCSLGATRFIYNRISLFKSDRSGIIISISICDNNKRAKQIRGLLEETWKNKM